MPAPFNGRRPSRLLLRLGAPMAFAVVLSACPDKHGDCGGIVCPKVKTEVTAISVSASNSSAIVGQSITLTASVTATGGAATTVTWSSSNSAVASVQANGGNSVNVTAVAPGSVTFTATSTVSTGISGSTTVTFTPPPDAFASASAQPTSVTLNELATADVQVSAVGAQSGATFTYSFSSSDVTKATVQPLGNNGQMRITGVAAGSPIITATIVGSGTALTTVTKNVAIPVTVSALPLACTGLSVQPRTATLAIGATQNVAPAASGVGAGATAQYTYTSSAPAVASVSATGTITGVGQGNASITVTANCAGTGFKAVSIVDVVQVTVTAPEALRGVTLSPSTASIAVGTGVTLVPSFDKASAAVTTTCTYTSDSLAIATVSAGGVVTGVAPGVIGVNANCTGSGAGFATSSRSASAAITVTAVQNACTGASITPTSLALNVGNTSNVAGTAAVRNGTVTAVGSYVSSDPAKVSVNSAGLVTGVAPGTAQVTYSAVCTGAGFVQNTVQASASVVVAGGTAPAITTWVPILLPASVRADFATRSWSATASTWFVTGSDDVSTAGGGVWRTDDAGTTWSKVFSMSARGTAITGTSATDVWVGTTDGRIFQINGTTGTQRRAQTFETINSLSIGRTIGFSSTITGVWAIVGTRKVELAQDAGAFTPITVSVLGALNLYAVGTTSATQAFVAGDSGVIISVPTSGAATRVHTMTDAALVNDIYVSPSGVMFAGGTRCTTSCTGRVSRYTGASWVADNTLNISFVDAIAGNSANDVYVLNWPNEIQRFNGTTWSAVGGGNPRWDDGRTLMSPTAGTVVLVGSFRASLQRNTTNTWSVLSVLPDFYDAHTTSTGQSFFVGDTKSIIKSSSTAASFYATSAQNSLYSVFAFGDDDIVAGGIGTISRVTNGVEVSTTAVGFDVYDIDGNAGTVFAVGTGGKIARLNGSAWTTSATSTTQNLNAVWMASPRFGFIGGNGGVLFRWNGTTWSAVTSPTAANIYRAWGADSANAWISDANNIAYQWNGTTWTQYALGGTLGGVLSGGANSPTDLYLSTPGQLRRVLNGAATNINLGSGNGILQPNHISVLTAWGVAGAVGNNGGIWVGRPAGGFQAMRIGGVQSLNTRLLQGSNAGATVRKPERNAVGTAPSRNGSARRQ